MITSEIKTYIDRSVLCWLATSSSANEPNVSPKEVFTTYQDQVIIANIASPQSIQNIKENNKVCVSFIDIFEQKGFQLKGTANIIIPDDNDYNRMLTPLEIITEGRYPIINIILINVLKSKRIIAPSYMMYPDITLEDRRSAVKKTYGV